MNTNLDALMNDLQKNEQEEREEQTEFFADDTLTDEERERLKKFDDTEHVVLVNDVDANGNQTQTAVQDYMASLDEKVADLISADKVETLKTLNSGDITKGLDELREEAKQKALQAFHSLSVNTNNISDEDYIEINNRTIALLQEKFSMERIDADEIVKRLRRYSLKDICAMLPNDFVSIYVTNAEIKANNIRAKERVLSAIAYLAVTGPEMNYLYEYIDNENKLYVVSKRLLECQVKLLDMLKDKKLLSEIIAETLKKESMDTSFWAHYIKMPNRVHNEFAQRVVIQEKYLEAYQEILAEYEDIPENQRAREVILTEINEAKEKIRVYNDICDLTLFKSLTHDTMERIKSNKKTSMKSIIVEMTRNIERVRKCRVNLPFPGYQEGDKNVDHILSTYLVSFGQMLKNYNHTIKEVQSKAETDQDKETVNAIQKIALDGYQDEDVFMMFSMILLLVMGRIVKKFSSADTDKYGIITVDAYFQLYCKLGLDIYIMTDVWSLLKDDVQYFLDHYYLPEKKKGTPKHT